MPGNTSHQRQSTQGFPYRSLDFRLAGNFFHVSTKKPNWKLFLWQENSCFKGFFRFPFWKPAAISFFIVRRMCLQLSNNSATSWLKTYQSALRKCWMDMFPCTAMSRPDWEAHVTTPCSKGWFSSQLKKVRIKLSCRKWNQKSRCQFQLP